MAKKQDQRAQQPQQPRVQKELARPVERIVQKAGSLEAYRPITWDDTNEPIRKAFSIIALVGLVIMLFMALGSGINADEKFQYSYADKLMNYYGSMGKDTSALYVQEGIMHFYGGFFEITTSSVSKAIGYSQNDAGYYHVRHLFSALLGWLAIVFAALLARRIAGWQAGLITLILLLLSPRLIGESLMNPKDIPFAAGYAIALYFFVCLLQSLQAPKKAHMIGLAAGIGIALGTRAGGLLIFAYIGLFSLVDMYVRSRAGDTVPFMRYVKTLGLPALAGYVIAILFWPWAMQNPLKAPFEALTQFTQYEIGIRVLFDGSNIMSDAVPWHYPLTWIGLTIPLAALLGLLGGLVMVYKLVQKYQPVPVLLVAFGSVFPLAYVIYSGSNLYDGWRHFTFVYPCIGIVAGLFWNELTVLWKENKSIKYCILGFFALLLVDAAYFIGANYKLPYVYFNPLNGGTSGALGHYETDYWGVSIRQGVEWLEQQGILNDHMDQPVVIASNMHFPLLKHTAKYGDKVIIKYMKYDRRCDDAWDYALYPSRFINGETLRKNNFPPDNAVHTITAGGAPILSILKDNGKNCALGMGSFKVSDFDAAIPYFEKETQNVPDNDIAWGYLSSAYLNTGKLEQAKAAAQKCLDLSPNDMQGNNMLGLYYVQMRDYTAAKAQFQNAVKREEQNATAWYYLALITSQQGDGNTALSYLEKCLKYAPNFKAAYDMAASIHDAMGNTQQAANIRQMMQKIK
jgi:tetratricopeptide (TPR) repeat protein